MKPRNLVRLQLQFIADFDDQPIVRFRDLVSQSVRQHLDLLAKGVKEARHGRKVSDIERQMIASYQEAEVFFLEEVQDLADSLSILALYSKLEITIKHMCKIGIPGVNPRNLFSFDKLARCLKGAGINIRTLAGYKEVDELRLLNNAIKHAGVAGRELTKYGWKVDDPIKAITPSYPDFQAACIDFVKSLRNALIGAQP